MFNERDKRNASLLIGSVVNGVRIGREAAEKERRKALAKQGLGPASPQPAQFHAAPANDASGFGGIAAVLILIVVGIIALLLLR